MKIWIALYALIPIGLCGDTSSLLPLPESIPNWTYEFEPEMYAADNLHEYINGEAELYKRYDVIDMATASYINPTDPSLTFTIDIYNMGTALNAFGIYSYYRHPDMNFADIGEQAIISDVSVRFWKGQYFVSVVGGRMDSQIQKVILNAAEKVASEIHALDYPQELMLLDSLYQRPNTLKYICNTEWENVKITKLLQADYQIENASWRGFVILAADKSAIDELQSKDNVLLKTTTSYIFGVYDFTNQKIAQEYLSRY